MASKESEFTGSIYDPSTFLSMDILQGVNPSGQDDFMQENRNRDFIDMNISPLESLSSDLNWGMAASSDNEANATVESEPTDERQEVVNPRKDAGLKREDVLWGAWFFFSHYYRPVFSDESSSAGATSAEAPFVHALASRGDTSARGSLDIHKFVVQHDMENCYKWMFIRRPANALPIRKLIGFIAKQSTSTTHAFPYSEGLGFKRTNSLQRRKYKALWNPKCVHGIKLVQKPSFENVSKEAMDKWGTLTGRGPDFALPSEAVDFTDWRPSENLPESAPKRSRSSRSPLPIAPATRPANASGAPGDYLRSYPTLGLSMDSRYGMSGVVFGGTSSRPSESPFIGPPPPLSIGVVGFQGTLGLGQDHGPVPAGSSRNAPSACPLSLQPSTVGDSGHVNLNLMKGPVVCAKCIYEDEYGFLVVVSLPLVDISKLRITCFNMNNVGMLKIHFSVKSFLPTINRFGRMFRVADGNSELPSCEEYVREIALPSSIAENVEAKAYMKEGSIFEILVPKCAPAVEREVRLIYNETSDE